VARRQPRSALLTIDLGPLRDEEARVLARGMLESSQRFALRRRSLGSAVALALCLSAATPLALETLPNNDICP